MISLWLCNRLPLALDLLPRIHAHSFYAHLNTVLFSSVLRQGALLCSHLEGGG